MTSPAEQRQIALLTRSPVLRQPFSAAMVRMHPFEAARKFPVERLTEVSPRASAPRMPASADQTAYPWASESSWDSAVRTAREAVSPRQRSSSAAWWSTKASAAR